MVYEAGRLSGLGGNAYNFQNPSLRILMYIQYRSLQLVDSVLSAPNYQRSYVRRPISMQGYAGMPNANTNDRRKKGDHTQRRT